MKNNSGMLKLLTASALFTIAVYVTSCKKDDDPYSAEVNQTISAEATQESQQDEVDDIASAQLNANDQAGGRAMTGDDSRTSCAKVTAELNQETHLGTLVIDFDHNSDGGVNESGCTDAKGNVRKGKITIAVTQARWWVPGAVITITLDDYSINGVVINGTRVLTNVTTDIFIPTWTVVAEHSATWPDNTTATRTVHKTRAWDIALGTVTVTQTAGAASAAGGTTRHAIAYTVTITEALVFKVDCVLGSKIYLPVSGKKVVAFRNKEITINFGSGTCDATFDVTFDGHSKSFTAQNGDGD